MSFQAAPYLLTLLLIPLVLAAYVLAQRRRQHYAVRFSALELLASVAPRTPGWRRHLPAALLCLALAALAVALARPQASVAVSTHDADVVLVTDVSTSMAATDRPDAARRRPGGGDDVRQQAALGRQGRRRGLLEQGGRDQPADA